MNAKGKKLIVPVVAIMMCAVALAGVAYAATQATVTSNTNTVDYGSFQIDLKNDGGTAEVANPWFNNTAVVDFGRVKVVGNETPTWNVSLHGGSPLVLATGKLVVTENKDDSSSHSKFTLGASLTGLAAAVSAVVTIKVQYSTDNVTYNDIGAGVSDLDIGTDYYVRVVAVLSAAVVSAGNVITNVDYTAFTSASKSMNVAFTADIV